MISTLNKPRISEFKKSPSYNLFEINKLETIVDDNFDNFNILLDIHTQALSKRTTRRGTNLKDRTESRIRGLIYAHWFDYSALYQVLEKISAVNTKFAVETSLWIKERLEEGFISLYKNQSNLKNKESFPWVSTEVGFGFENLDTSGWKKHDLLSKLGYKTGNYSDLNAETRREILYKAYQEDIPKSVAILFESIESWGEPNSPTRLRKIAESIALIVRSEKMHSYNYDVSISERESDLADLKKKFYDGNYDE